MGIFTASRTSWMVSQERPLLEMPLEEVIEAINEHEGDQLALLVLEVTKDEVLREAVRGKSADEALEFWRRSGRGMPSDLAFHSQRGRSIGDSFGSAQADTSREHFKNFEISDLSFKDGSVQFRLFNKNDFTVRRAGFEYEYVGVERDVPWFEGTGGTTFSGGLGPGESKEVRFRISALSLLAAGIDVKPDSIFRIGITSFTDADSAIRLRDDEGFDLEHATGTRDEIRQLFAGIEVGDPEFELRPHWFSERLCINFHVTNKNKFPLKSVQIECVYKPDDDQATPWQGSENIRFRHGLEPQASERIEFRTPFEEFKAPRTVRLRIVSFVDAQGNTYRAEEVGFDGEVEFPGSV